MNNPKEYSSLEGAEKIFLQQLHTPEFFSNRGGKREVFDRKLHAMITDLERKKTTPLAVISFIREKIQYKGWRSFFFFQTPEIQEFLIRADLYPEQPYEHISVVRALLPPLTSLVKTIEENYRTLSVLRNSEIALPKPVFFSGQPGIISPGEFTGVPSSLRRKLSEHVPVMVIDSGIDYQHDDLAHIPESRCLDFTGGNDPMDYNGHGTHCSGILAGSGTLESEMTGVAPGVDLFHGKVEHTSGMLSLESALTALDWALGERIPIISMSLGSPADPHIPSMLSEIVEEAAVQNPVFICCAAGNSGMDEDTGYPCLETIASPADCAHVIAVGAVDRNLKLAPFSSKGSPNPKSLQFRKPDLCGPGVLVKSCKSKQNSYSYKVREPYITMNGTSMAAPYIAGIAAVAYGALDKDLPEQEKVKKVKQFMIESAGKPLNRSGTPYHEYEVGHGVPNLRKILIQLGFPLRKEEINMPGKGVKRGTAPFPVGERMCNWSGIPIGNEWIEGKDYYLCEDCEDAYISAAAFQRLGAQSSGRKVSKEFLRNDYWARYAQYREKTALLQEKQQRQIELFRQNVLDEFPRASFTEKRKQQIFRPLFFLKNPPPEPVEFLQAFFAILRMKKTTRVYALLWDLFDGKELPEAEEYWFAVDDPALRLKDSLLGKKIEYVLLQKGVYEGEAYWVPENSEGPHSAMFFLEKKYMREKRCIEEIENAFDLHVSRTTLPMNTAEKLTDIWGIDFLLALTSELFTIAYNEGHLVIARKK